MNEVTFTEDKVHKKNSNSVLSLKTCSLFNSSGVDKENLVTKSKVLKAIKQKIELMCISYFKGIQACSYPGTVISGRMSSVKFYYSIGETIKFTCEEDLVLQGSEELHCLSSGKWSNTIPACVPMESVRYNLTIGKN